MQAIRTAALGVALVMGSALGVRGQAAPPAAGVPQQSAPGAARVRGSQQLAGIELSAEQKAKLEAITLRYAEENKGGRDLMATNPAEAMKKMLAVREQMLPELRAVLTVEQRAIFDTNVAAMKARIDLRIKPD